jgi:hypothetical protein
MAYVLNYANGTFIQPMSASNVGGSGGQNPSGGSGANAALPPDYNGFTVGNVNTYGAGRGNGGQESRDIRRNGYALIVRNG